MLSIEVKVNGAPVVVINMVNLGLANLTPEKLATYTYRYTGVIFPLDNKDAMPLNGSIEHARSRGILELIKTVLKKI